MALDPCAHFNYWIYFRHSLARSGNLDGAAHQDSQGKLWIGTNAGLARLDGDKFVVMTTEQGLFSNNVFSMATGPGGDQWIGSFGGVAHLKAPK